MSDEHEPDPNGWVWQGFAANMDVATVRKAVTDLDPRAGVSVPPVGAPPMPWNISKTRAMWAVQTRRSAPIPTPEGCDEADPAIVGRLVGA